MRVIYYIIILAVLSPLVGFGQTDEYLYLNSRNLQNAPFEHNPSVNFDLENYSYYILRKNPAYVQLYRDELSKIDTTATKKEIGIFSESYYSRTDGEYLSHKGNGGIASSLMAIGENEIKEIGTIFGAASYETGTKNNTSLNYTSRYMDYYPYLATDTVGLGSSRCDSYRMNGGFSFKQGKTYLGVAGEYEGIVARRLSDPRYSSYLSLLKLDFAVVSNIKRSLLALRVSPELSWQSIAVSDYSNRGAHYFQLYGFGQWNRKETDGGYSHHRFLTTNGVNVDFTWQTKSQRQDLFQCTFNVLFNIRNMSTLETNNKNLFETKTYYVKPELNLFKRLNRWDIHLLLGYHLSTRSGTEHVYEKQLVDAENYLHDDVKVASSELYSLSEATAISEIKGICNLTPTKQIHLLIGANINDYNEEYLTPQRKVNNSTFSSFVGIGYSAKSGRSNIEFFAKVKKQTNLDGNLSLNVEDNILAQELVYVPYFIRGVNSLSFSGELLYSYVMRSERSVGMSIKGELLNGTNNTSLSNYTDYLFHQKQTICYANLRLFYLF